MDLMKYGITGESEHREFLEIPSIVFVEKCEQTRRTHDVKKKGPLPPS